MASDSSSPVRPERPEYQPLERFWPYADLAEQPSEAELADLHPELRQVLFGAPVLPFSMSIVFPSFEGSAGEQAVARARQADEYVEFRNEGATWHRARFFPGRRPAELRDLYDIVSAVPGVDVLVDDRPVPYARELWLPLVWFLIR